MEETTPIKAPMVTSHNVVVSPLGIDPPVEGCDVLASVFIVTVRLLDAVGLSL